MQSEFSWAGRLVGHSAKSVCEIGLKLRAPWAAVMLIFCIWSYKDCLFLSMRFYGAMLIFGIWSYRDCLFLSMGGILLGTFFDTPTTRMEIRTWRSAIADLKPPPPGAPSGALEEGTPAWGWRCDAAISRYYHQKTCLFVRFSPFFSHAAKTPKWRHFR